MEKKLCPKCGTEIIGKPFYSHDDQGNVIQLIDFSCACGYGRIKNPEANIP